MKWFWGFAILLLIAAIAVFNEPKTTVVQRIAAVCGNNIECLDREENKLIASRQHDLEADEDRQVGQ